MFQLVWRICTFQSKPGEVPYSIPLLSAKIIINLSVLVLILTIATSSLEMALWRSLIFVGIIAGYSYGLLYYYRLEERFVQLMSGLLASMAMILITLAIPYVLIMFFLSDVTSNSLYFSGLVLSNLLLIIASMWLYVVYARIYKHALEISINQGLTTSLMLFIISSIVFFLL